VLNSALRWYSCVVSQKKKAKEEQAQLGGIWLPESEFAGEDDDDEFGDSSDDSGDSDSNSEDGGASDSGESDDDDGDDGLGFEIVRRSKSKRSKSAALVDADEESASVSIASEDARVTSSSGPLVQTTHDRPIAAKPKRKKVAAQVAAQNIASGDDDDDDFQCTRDTATHSHSVLPIHSQVPCRPVLLQAVIHEMNQRAQQTLTMAAANADGAEKRREKAGQ
jgi:hypothetical protein